MSEAEEAGPRVPFVFRTCLTQQFFSFITVPRPPQKSALNIIVFRIRMSAVWEALWPAFNSGESIKKIIHDSIHYHTRISHMFSAQTVTCCYDTAESITWAEMDIWEEMCSFLQCYHSLVSPHWRLANGLYGVYELIRQIKMSRSPWACELE